MRGLYYCQHLRGLGHLIRSLQICKYLVQDFDIHFIQGGIDADLTVHSPRFYKHLLPPLAFSTDKGLYDPLSDLSFFTLADLFKKRQEILLPIIQQSYDFIITGFFPFKHFFLYREIVPIIRQARINNPKCLNICLGIDLPMGVSHDQNITLQLLNDYYDYVFALMDPTIITLEDMFSATDKIGDKIVYTGFVTDPEPVQKSVRQKQILVSMGAGVVGENMIRAVAAAASLVPEYEFIFATGPHINIQLLDDLKRKALQSGNIRVIPFLNDFEAQLSRSALSISMAGSSMNNVCRTRTPALVYPAIDEQVMRAKRFAEKGLVHILTPSDFPPETLAGLIKSTIHAPYPDLHVNFDGGKNMAKKLLELLESKK